MAGGPLWGTGGGSIAEFMVRGAAPPDSAPFKETPASRAERRGVVSGRRGRRSGGRSELSGLRLSRSGRRAPAETHLQPRAPGPAHRRGHPGPGLRAQRSAAPSSKLDLAGAPWGAPTGPDGWARESGCRVLGRLLRPDPLRGGRAGGRARVRVGAAGCGTREGVRGVREAGQGVGEARQG